MTQTLDGSPLPEEHTLDDLPLGRADALKTGDELAILGFPSELRPVESLEPELAAVLEALDSSNIIEVYGSN